MITFLKLKICLLLKRTIFREAYRIAGYAVAAGTGYFRMYNDRHWLTDVAAGAGIGMLSTKIAYKLHPFLKRKLFKNKKNWNGIVMPRIEGDSYGIIVSMMF